MFDNEIDWVTRLECWCVRREAHGSANDSKHVYIQGRAQAIELLSKLSSSGKCSSKKSVFRRCSSQNA